MIALLSNADFQYVPKYVNTCTIVLKVFEMLLLGLGVSSTFYHVPCHQYLYKAHSQLTYNEILESPQEKKRWKSYEVRLIR